MRKGEFPYPIGHPKVAASWSHSHIIIIIIIIVAKYYTIHVLYISIYLVACILKSSVSVDKSNKI